VLAGTTFRLRSSPGGKGAVLAGTTFRLRSSPGGPVARRSEQVGSRPAGPAPALLCAP
jgi:hypothetical protein